MLDLWTCLIFIQFECVCIPILIFTTRALRFFFPDNKVITLSPPCSSQKVPVRQWWRRWLLEGVFNALCSLNIQQKPAPSGWRRHRTRHYRTPPHESTVLLFSSFFFFVLSCRFQLCLLHPVGAQKPHSPIISKRWRKGGTKREGSALRCLITSKGFLCSRAFIFESRDWELFLPHTKLPRANSLKSLTITYKACSPIGHFNIFKTEHVMCLLFERIFASEISEGK